MPLKFIGLLALLFTLHATAQDTTRPGTSKGIQDTTKPKTLKEITVKGRPKLVEKLLDKTVVNVDQQNTNAGATVLELMQKLPGVQVTSDGQITLNGRGGVLVYLDGKPTWLSAEDLARQLSGMSSSSIQKIEIMTNPSARYDAAGSGGIINIIRKKGGKEGLNGSLTGTFGQALYSRYNGGLVLNYRTSRYNIYLNDNYGYSKNLHSRDVTSNIFSNGRLQTQQVSANDDIPVSRSSNTTAGIDCYLSKNTTLTISGNATARKDLDRTRSQMTIFDGHQDRTGGESFSALNTDRPFNYTAGGQLSHKFDTTGRELSIDADYSGFHYKPGQYNTTLNTDAAGDFLNESDIFLDQSRRLRILGARVDYVHPLKGNGKWEAGLKTSRVTTKNNSTYYDRTGGQNQVDSSQSDYTLNTENIDAAYFNFNRQYKKWNVQAGLRAEHTLMTGDQLYTGQSVRQDYFQLFPTLFAQYKLSDHSNLNVQLGRRIDRADYHELVPFRRPLTPTLYYEGNPNLRPSLNWHGELGWSWENTIFLTIAGDHDKDYARTIPFLDSNKTTTTRIPTNIRNAYSWNIDLSYNKEMTKWWSTNTSISIYRNIFAGEVNGFSLDNNGIVSLDLTANNHFSLTGTLSVEADLEYSSKRQIVTSTFGGSSTLSIGLKQMLLQNKASLTLNCRDVFQSEGHYAIDRYADLYQYSYFWFNNRALLLTLNYRFGSDKPARTQRRSGSEQEQQRAGN